jgi:methionine-rich copper-binding protein CopC
MFVVGKCALPLFLAAHLLLPATARASLERLTPSFEPLRAPDANLVLNFPDEMDVASSRIELIDAHSRHIQTDKPELSDDGKGVNLPLRAPLQPGVYTVKWRATSINGRVDHGSYNFHVDP